MGARFRVVPPVKRHGFCGRRLIAVDIENVLGGADFSSRDVLIAQELIEAHVGSLCGEMVIVSMSHMGMFDFHRAWAGARALYRSGPNGADYALIRELQQVDIPKRFTEVVLASGDGIFTDTVVRLTASGLKVTVLAPEDGCSKRLQMAAHQTIPFVRPETDFKDAA